MSYDTTFFFAAGKRISLDVKVFGKFGETLGTISFESKDLNWDQGLSSLHDLVEPLCQVLSLSSDPEVLEVGLRLQFSCSMLEYPHEVVYYLMATALAVNYED